MQRGSAVLVPSVRVGTLFEASAHALNGGPVQPTPFLPVARRVSGGSAGSVQRIGVGPHGDESICDQNVPFAPGSVKRRPAADIPCVHVGAGLDQDADDRGVDAGCLLPQGGLPPRMPRRGMERGVAACVLRMDVGARGQQRLHGRGCTLFRSSVQGSVPRFVRRVHIDPAPEKNGDGGRTRVTRRRVKRSLALAGAAECHVRTGFQEGGSKGWVLAVGGQVQRGPSHVVLNVGIRTRREQPGEEPPERRGIDVVPVGHGEVERSAAQLVGGVHVRSRFQQGLCDHEAGSPSFQRLVQRRGSVGPVRIHRHPHLQQKRDHRRIFGTGGFVKGAVPLPVSRIGVGPRLQQEPCDGLVSGARREVEWRIPVVVGGPRIGARLDEPDDHRKVRGPFGAAGAGKVGRLAFQRDSQDRMVQRRVAVLVASLRVGTRLDATIDVGDKGHTAEHPPVPVIAVGGVGAPAELVTGGRVGPEPQEFAYDYLRKS